MNNNRIPNNNMENVLRITLDSKNTWISKDKKYKKV